MGGFSVLRGFAPTVGSGVDWTGIARDVAKEVIGGVIGGIVSRGGGNGSRKPVEMVPGGGPIQTYPPITIQGGTVWAPRYRRGRRMNVLNPKALRRSMRRVQGFAKFAKKTISFTRRVKMKKARRRVC